MDQIGGEEKPLLPKNNTRISRDSYNSRRSSLSERTPGYGQGCTPCIKNGNGHDYMTASTNLSLFVAATVTTATASTEVQSMTTTMTLATATVRATL